MDESTAELAASAWFEAVQIRVLAASDFGKKDQATAKTAILSTVLRAAIQRLNPSHPPDTVEEVMRTVSHVPHSTLIENNRWFHSQVTDGVEVEYADASGVMRGGRARLVDFESPRANDLFVVRQLSVVGLSGRVIRPDLTVFSERAADCGVRTQGPC